MQYSFDKIFLFFPVPLITDRRSCLIYFHTYHIINIEKTAGTFTDHLQGTGQIRYIFQQVHAEQNQIFRALELCLLVNDLVLFVLLTVQVALTGQCHTLLDFQKIISALFPTLHLIQGCICPPEQQIIVCHCSIRNRSSQTAGDMQSCFIIIIAVRHTAIQLSKLLFQFLSWHILYIAYELVSTNPAFQRLGKQFIHFICKRTQYRISKQMSVCIVDFFKTIHIQNNKVSHLSPFHFLQSVCDLLLDGGMIQKSSQGIPL